MLHAVLVSTFVVPQWCQQVSDPLLQLCCLDASIAVKPIFDKFHTVY